MIRFLKVFRLYVLSLQVHLDLLENSQCCESWEFFPLEFNCFSIKTNCVLVWGILCEIFNLSCPFRIGGSWIVFYFLPAHRTESAWTQTFAFIHLIGLSLNSVDLIHEGDWYSSIFTFRISSECFFINFLSDVEHILDVLEFCIIVDFRILQEIWAKVDGCLHRWCHELSPCPYIVFIMIDPLRTQNSLKFFPVSSVRIEISSQRKGNWRISCFQFLLILLQVALCFESLLHFSVTLSLSAQVSLQLGWPSLVDTLGNFQLRNVR